MFLSFRFHFPRGGGVLVSWVVSLSAGRFQDESAAAPFTRCKSCPAAHFQDESASGATICKGCGVGRFEVETTGVAACDACPSSRTGR